MLMEDAPAPAALTVSGLFSTESSWHVWNPQASKVDVLVLPEDFDACRHLFWMAEQRYEVPQLPAPEHPGADAR